MSRPRPAADPLAPFDPRVAAWFRERVGEPTPVQVAAWPEIAAGRHALITAPTGSGKTLTAFLWGLDRLLTGVWPGGRTRLLYVSPLKALNNDIQRNLLVPLAELRDRLPDAPAVRVATRSGDTPDAERRRTTRHPPEILITTPESLNILLTSAGGRSILGDLETVIVDEIHAVVGSKRGTHLITAVDRLVGLSGEFQRLALSATVRPLDRVARFVGGWSRESGSLRPRPVAIVEAPRAKAYDIGVDFPAACGPTLTDPTDAPDAPGVPARADAAPLWDGLADAFRERIRANRSTLLFANSRRLTEKVTRLVNEGEAEELAYSHHGSLSREIRAVVEERLKEGRLRALVATNSLELGIDIGALDEVLLVQTPKSVASALQRIGRAGHSVGETSRGRFYPTFARDFVDAAVVARAALDGDIEEVRPLEGPLDVLAQVILSMTATESWSLDELYDSVVESYPYRRLSRAAFDRLIEMLAGRYADSRIRELRPRIAIDRVEGTVRARPGVARLLYTNGGTIPERGYFTLRLHESGARIGELDEEFVWERTLGETFTLGAQAWRIRQITHNDVVVTPSRSGAAMAPFWRADAQDRGWHLSERIGLFLERLEGRLRSREPREETRAWLAREHLLAPTATRELLRLVDAQRAWTGVALPHRHHLLAERSADPTERDGRRQLVIHTLWGGRINRPLAIALAAAWEERWGWSPEIYQDDDCVAVEEPEGGIETEELLAMVDPARLEELLRRRLEKTGFFGAHFRMAAGCALLLPRASFRRRQPLWLVRQRAKTLLEAVAGSRDFPVVVETWRACLDDAFDIPELRRRLDEVASGETRISRAVTDRPSPFAANLSWLRTNRLMYEDDTPETSGPALSAGLLRELVHSSELRPRIPAEIVDELERKLRRFAPGYPPTEAGELVEWLKERRLLSRREWRELAAAIEREVGHEAVAALLEEASARLFGLVLPGGDPEGAVVAVESLRGVLEAVGSELAPAGARLVSLTDPGAEPRTEALEALGRLENREAEDQATPDGVPDGVQGPDEDAATDPLEDLVADLARFRGPFPRERLAALLGTPAELQAAVDSLVEAETLVVDTIRRGAPDDAEPELCDTENLERLLRMLRAAGRPSFEAVPLERLPGFLAAVQGLTAAAGGVEGLRGSLERLFGYPAPARAWEDAILPARLEPYYLPWLDGVFQESELIWRGCGKERLTFAFESEMELMVDAMDAIDGTDRAGDLPSPDGGSGEAAARILALLTGPGGERPRRSVAELVHASGLSPAALSEALWQLAWEGRVSNTTWLAVRRGIQGRFRTDTPTGGAAAPRTERRRTAGRRRAGRWLRDPSDLGDWFALPAPAPGEAPDALEREELNKERVRLLLERYGVLFRELLERELPAFRWRRLFRTLRIMELSGEVLAGHFFHGVPGLQFIAPAAFRRLREGLDDSAIFWITAVDPASPCGLGLEQFEGRVPPRLPSTHLVFHGSSLVVVSRGNGRHLEIAVAPDHPKLPDYLAFLGVLLTRPFDPLKAITVETLNAEPAHTSAYTAILAAGFDATQEPRAIKLRRRYG